MAQEELLGQFRNMHVSEGPTENTTAQTLVNASGHTPGISLNNALECVRMFDGKPSDVRDFVSSCRLAKRLLPNYPEEIFVEIIKTKLKGGALIAFTNQPFSRLETFLAEISKYYGQQRSLSTLHAEMGLLRQGALENVEAYSSRAIALLDEIVDSTTAEMGETQAITTFPVTQNIMVKSFLRGLRREIEARLVGIRPTNLRDAVLAAKAAEREITEIERIHDPRTSTHPTKYCSICRNTSHETVHCRSRRAPLPNRAPLTCNYCKKLNHTSEVCYQRRNDERRRNQRQNPSYNTRGAQRNYDRVTPNNGSTAQWQDPSARNLCRRCHAQPPDTRTRELQQGAECSGHQSEN